MVLDATPEESLHQVFSVPKAPDVCLNAAAAYLEGAGRVTPKLAGRLERFGDSLAVHHGRIVTRVQTEANQTGTRVEITRRGQRPLENTRRWLLLLGLGGFLLAWGLTFFQESRTTGLSPVLTMMLFLGALVATVAVLFVADRSLERRSEGLVLALEDAMKGDPHAVLRREIDLLERGTALGSGFLFYCAGLVASFIIYAILWSPEIVRDIDQAVALTTMRFVFLFPIVPALLFALGHFLWQNRVHARALAQ